MKLKRSLLLLFVEIFHMGQKRKYTGERYTRHVVNVAKMSEVYCKTGYAYEVGLCHDLFEDTICSPRMLNNVLWLCGYKKEKRVWIIEDVLHLTDVYTKEDYPKLNREARKKLEALRLSKCDYSIQTIKYCDLIDNTKSITEHDPGFAKIYLEEKRYVLSLMDKGNQEAYEIGKSLTIQTDVL